MLISKFTSAFRNDIKKYKNNSRYNIEDLKSVMTKIVQEEKLDISYKDHHLIGNYKGYRECHIKPDWLLIYYIDCDTVVFVRTGFHSDLY